MSKENTKEAIELMEKKYGKGVVMKLKDSRKVNIDVIPTGSLSLDYALGIGGVPRGRIIEVYGPESSGKTTLSLHIIAEAQKQGLQCAFIDAEHALDPEYAEKIGVQTKDLYISQPDSGEQALDIVESFVKTGEFGVIVVDSVAALAPIAEIEGQMGAHHIGLLARLMSQALRKLTAITSKHKTTVIFINQIRLNIGQTWGNPETTPGGKALKFFTSQRIEIRRTSKLSRGDESIGNRVKAKVAKNKLAPPFKVCEFDILFDRGIYRLGDLFTLATKQKIITKDGNTYYFEEEKLGVGIDNAKKKLESLPAVAEKIEKKLREVL